MSEFVGRYKVVLMEVDGSVMLRDVDTFEYRWVSLEEFYAMRADDEQPEGAAQVATHFIGDGGTLLLVTLSDIDSAGDVIAQDVATGEQFCYTRGEVERAIKATTKVEKFAENLKHLDKPEAHDLRPHGLIGGGITYKVDLGNASFYFRKMCQGRNKSSVVTPVGELGYSNIPYRDLGDKDNFLFVLDCQKSLEGGGLGFYATSGFLFDEGLYQQYMFHRCSDDNGAPGVSDITGNKPWRRETPHRTETGRNTVTKNAPLGGWWWHESCYRYSISGVSVRTFRWLASRPHECASPAQVVRRESRKFWLESLKVERYLSFMGGNVNRNKAQVNRYHACKTY